MNSTKSNILIFTDSLTYLFQLLMTDLKRHKDELQYLAIEHLCVGHTYRLLSYPEAEKQDFKEIIRSWKVILENNGIKNKYVKKVYKGKY